MSPTVLVIGAGMAGLSAARVLSGRSGIDSLLLVDKARRAGGRLATRDFVRGESAGRYDFGAQFFTARSTRFIEQAQDWIGRGIVVEWCRGFENDEGHPRCIGRAGMNSLAQDLARGLPIRCGWLACSMTRLKDRWRVTSETGDSLEARVVILTLPVPQAISLLQTTSWPCSAEVMNRLASVQYDPCLAVMVELDQPSRLPPPGAMQVGEGPIRWIADNQRKGISPGRCVVTLHGSAAFSRDWIDGDREEGGRLLVEAARDWLGSDAVNVFIHGWRYSMPARTDPDRALVACSDPLLVLCGDAFNGPRVEGAYLSGVAAAEAVLQTL
jgi:predicted NAD/FAD-dependent oxidoreductase